LFTFLISAVFLYLIYTIYTTAVCSMDDTVAELELGLWPDPTQPDPVIEHRSLKIW